jgi:clan AA aspartic protease
MILGTFRQGHPRIVLIIIGPNGRLSIEFIVDTGFEGQLALPAAIVARLGLGFNSYMKWALADGTMDDRRMYEAAVDLDGDERPVEVLVVGDKCLLGTEFLKGYFVQIEMDEDGEVTAEEM